MRRTPEDLERRAARLPKPEFPPELPVSARRDDIARAILEHQVVIVCGETGSGKTTQLPKICLAIGRGVQGLIGHTQPRRIAARATATRIAQELKSELGDVVGYKVRFTDRSSRDGYVKLMTDGILLAETQTDRKLWQYDTLIIDEAHERSLNIDFLLGYVRQLLPKRPDLKLIITSATTDAERFAKQFGGAPVIEVSGRTYPVEVRYRPPQPNDDGDIDLEESIVEAVDELAREGPGDVLVFLPGEREIRDTAEALRKHHPAETEILPLFSRLSAADQDRVFKAHRGRRVVLATNVAETSLTVPGIRYVVDTGLARVKRYSYRNKVEQLQIEKISQAAARQRAGRCGRVANGICIRLFDEEDHAKRPAYTDPEIQRSSLAAVILRMLALGLGNVEAFPFIDPPAPRAVSDGYALLQELGAIAGEGHRSKSLTPIGRQLAKLPLDPRVGRMILAANEEGSLGEVIVIAGALAIQDPRERPMERAQAADQAQKRFDDDKSDFISFLKLWTFFEEASHAQSRRKMQRQCHDLFLSYNRMREWRDTVAQLRELAGELGWKVADPSMDPSRYLIIHRALLTGLLGNVGLKGEDGAFLGARGIKFHVHPGSSIAKKAPRWVMAAELTETTRLYARNVAGIDPRWIESVGKHLVRKTHTQPHWEKKAAQVMALERGTLYGIPVYINRRVPFGHIDRETSRNLFIREALIVGDYDTRAPFFVHNQKLVREIHEIEHKARRPDVLVDEDLIYGFYDSKLPADIWSDTTLTAWRSKAEKENRRVLFLDRDDLMRHEAAGITTDQFPPYLDMAGRRFALEYLHDPGGPRDGVTMTIPIVALNQLNAARCEWLVPGLLKDKVALLVRSLPQKLRHQLGPQKEFAAKFMADVPPRDVPLTEAITRYIRDRYNLTVPLDGYRIETVPQHLFMAFRVLDEHGRQLGLGRSLAQLRSELGNLAEERFVSISEETTNESGLTSWTFGDLDDIMEIRQGGQTLIGYPALIDEGTSVRLQVMDSEVRARREHRRGLRRLFMLHLRDQAKFLDKGFGGNRELVMMLAVHGDSKEIREDLVDATFERTCMAAPLPRTQAEFMLRAGEARTRLGLVGNEIARLMVTITREAQAVLRKLGGAKAHPATVQDIEGQLDRLFATHFVRDVPYERLAQYPRYLKGILVRLDKLKTDPLREERLMAEMQPLDRDWKREWLRSLKSGEPDPAMADFRWMLEELRVSLFAQELRTPTPVSVKRLARMWQTILAPA